MKKELDKKLCIDHPNVFRDRYGKISENCMRWGFPGDGWYDLIDQIATELDRVKREYGIQFVATQVKEKFGSLRFYVSTDGRYTRLSKDKKNHIISSVSMFINNIQEKSEKICEECGDPATQTTGLWVLTLCDKCREKRQCRTTWKEIDNETV